MNGEQLPESTVEQLRGPQGRVMVYVDRAVAAGRGIAPGQMVMGRRYEAVDLSERARDELARAVQLVAWYETLLARVEGPYSYTVEDLVQFGSTLGLGER